MTDLRGGRAFATLAALAAALIAAFVVAPPTLAASGSGDGFVGSGDLTEALGEGFVEYWRSGDRSLSAGLASVVDYWFRYHVAKAVIATVVLIVLGALGVRLWRAFLRAGALGAGRRVALASAGVLVSLLALFSAAAVMVNVQGAVAPFASLLPMLTDGGTGGATGGELAATLADVRQRLAAAQRVDGEVPPALDVMIGDFARYHVAMAVAAAIVGVVLAGASVGLWKRCAATAPSDRRTGRVLGSLGALSALSALLLVVVAVANTTTAADPAPALMAFLDGGW